MNYLIGLDIGTSSTKGVLMRETGEVVASVAPEYEFRSPRPLWAESDPADWWAATVAALKGLLETTGIPGRAVAGIGLTGQMHGLVLLDRKGEVLRPCIMWNDQRTASQCASITAETGSKRVLQLTGNPVLPGFTAPKIVWVREHEPEVYARVTKVLLPKDYIRYKLSDEFFTDVSDASGTSLLDVSRRQWSQEMLDVCDIPRQWMAEVTESPLASTSLSAEAARLTGLRQGTPIIAGAGDQAAQAVGCGIVREGVLSATLGTSGVIFAHSDKYRVEPEGRLHAFCHAVPGRWHLMGVMLSAAGSFQWYRNTLGGEEMALEEETGIDAYDVLTASASEVPEGSEGLIFLPYLSGERTPYPDPHAKGVFFGLSLRHSKAHMTRSVLEGVTFGLRDSLELIRGLGTKVEHVVASGGGAKSPFWHQLLADIFGTRIVVVNATEGAAYGAAILGGVGAGLYASVEEACDQLIRVTDESMPSESASIYPDYYERYKALYPVLKDEFSSISALVERGQE